MSNSSLGPVAVIMTLHRADPLQLFEIAISSVERQTLSAAVHVYLCVDGPIPQSHEIWLDANRNRFYLVLQNETNLGLAKSLNRLIDVLEDEEFVFRMDGDDISLPARFERQIQLMQASTDLALCGCQAIDIDDEGRDIAPRRYPTDPTRTQAMLSRNNPILHPTYCIRRNILRNPNLRYPDAFLSEDLAFLILLAEAGQKISNHPDTLFKWRTGSNFFKRRSSVKRGLVELQWYSRALRLNGKCLSLEAVFPLLRLLMRLLPQKLLVRIYRSSFRDRFISSG